MIKDLFKIEKEPKKGLMAIEWVVLGYITLTFFVMLFTYTKLANPQAMLWERFRGIIITLALWGVYRAIPCRFTRLARVMVQMLMLSMWYSDTYEINRIFSNQDHIVAAWEQSIFGFQPALVFAKNFHWAVVSELMDMGYFSYYPMIALVSLFFFFYRYEEFERVTFVLLASFFIYYVIFFSFPVVGPTFYYDAVGVDDIAKGIFPPLEDYFNSHTDCLASPGYSDGIFYRLVEDAKAAGERPTAAFPSSHVGVSTICVFLAWRSKNRKLLYTLLPFYILLCMATVYIQAHYLIDAVAGFFSGAVLYLGLMLATKKMKTSV